MVVHVGEVYISGCQKKQWIFVTDGSKCSSQLPLEDQYDCVLAVSFCSSVNDNDLSELLSQCLAGTTVCNCLLHIHLLRFFDLEIYFKYIFLFFLFSWCLNIPNYMNVRYLSPANKLPLLLLLNSLWYLNIPLVYQCIYDNVVSGFQIFY